MKQPPSNAGEVFLEIETIRRALVKGSERGDFAETARVMNRTPAQISQYLVYGRNINTPTGRRILNTFAQVITERQTDEQRKRLIAELKAL